MLVLKTISVLFAALILFTHVSAASAPTVERTVKAEIKTNIINTGCQTASECIDKYSELYNVPKERLQYITWNESHYNKNAIGDMNLICPKTGLPVRARGVLQITECYHPEVSDECAFNIECSFSKMILIIKEDSNCRIQFSTCNTYLSM